ncbi:glycosyltransferase 87 family protein [Kitasatospora sp. NPDC059571]|uniref:glycosyltransferase 87 family protein n=1 Tax=Kitasatospora sp. NPDC059571 TaxID=3346871 RepID=UPI00367CC1F7
MVSPRTPDLPKPERFALPGATRGGTADGLPGRRAGGRSAARLAAHRGMQALGCAVAAAWAAAFPLFSDLPYQALWGRLAAPAYALAGLLCAVLPRRAAPRAAAAVALTGAVLLPLVLLAVHSRYQSEVMVVERSAHLLLTTGAPYLPYPAVPADYDPYLPAMVLFGLPRAVLGTGSAAARLLGDARIWFALAFLGCMLGTWRLLRPGRERAPLLPLAVLTASPLIALALSVGGVDLPLIGVCCLAMALTARERTLAAGLVLALACSLKWTAWPALPVAVLLAWRLYGRRTAARIGGTALAAAGAVVLPFVLTAGRQMREQVVRFPLGLAAVRTPAGSPLPGKVLADLGPTGHTLSLALLCLGGLVVAVWLAAYPPASAVAACDLLAAGLTVAFVLAPAGRFGYLALPTVLALWPRLAAGSLGRRPPRATARPVPGLVQV